MAHKTMIDGAAYEISGGKTLVDGTAYSIKAGKTLVGGTAYEVGFSGWPGDLDTGLEFASSNAFTISVAYPEWNGTMEYCNGEGWVTWDGSEISSGETEDGQRIYVRGIKNTLVTNGKDVRYPWTLTGVDIECNGNLENLLDYATVKAGGHPTIGNRCFGYMFYNCTSLTKAPSLLATTISGSYCCQYMFYNCTNLVTAPRLPATTISQGCYRYMFRNCTSLTAIPMLPATTLLLNCYDYMFYGCEKIKLSSTKTGTYTKAYRIPYSGTATNSIGLSYTFMNTGGTFTDNPAINTTYYLDSSNTIV